jgi:RNA polymerase sigma-70 factor (ECF subfamily)
VHRVRTGESNWAEIVKLYDVLFALTGSPVVAVNRVLAVAETAGPQVALIELDKIAADSRLAEYQPYWAVRAELLTKLKKGSEAREAYRFAIGLERDPAVKRFLQRRLDATSA